MMLPPEPSEQPTSVKTSSSETLKFSKKRLVLAFAIAAVSDAIGAFATPVPPIVWAVDIGTALLLFLGLGRQWMLLPGLALEAIPGFGVVPTALNCFVARRRGELVRCCAPSLFALAHVGSCTRFSVAGMTRLSTR